MIEKGLIQWLVTDYLSRLDHLPTYGLEYSTALLMNLCLHQSGKEQCVPIAKDILNLLTDLLVRDLSQVGLKTNRTI